MHKKIRNLREMAGMSQTDLAARLGVKPCTVSRWESGEKVPELTTLLKLADVFGVTLDYLLGRNEPG